VTEDSSLSLEHLNQEVERIGSLLRSMSVQISGIRNRVTDLELGGSKRMLVTAGKGKKKRPPRKVGKGRGN
jgi:hypothetical protein